MKHVTRWMIASCLAGAPIFIGCDRKVSHQETTERKRDGTEVHKEETVKQKSDGTVVKETEKSVDKPLEAPRNP